MKHLKRFNESAFGYDEKFDAEWQRKTQLAKIREFEDQLKRMSRQPINDLGRNFDWADRRWNNNTLFTPKTEQLPLKSLYKVIVIRTQEPINTEFLKSHAAGFPKEYYTNWILLDFKFGKFGISFYPDENAIKEYLSRGYYSNFEDHLIIGYNDINHAEIENILSEYGVVVDEMWGIPV